MEAMTPKEATDLKMSRIPPQVFEAFNEVIADNLSEGYANITQDEVVTAILAKMPDIKRQQIFDNGWLDVEPFYRKKGWRVEFDKPDFNETYSANWTFQAKRTK